MVAQYGSSSTVAPVTIVGAGPVGLITAYALAKRGVRCVLVEKRREATMWPKMDVTNCRSMELLGRLGLAREFRKIGELVLVFSLEGWREDGVTRVGKLRVRSMRFGEEAQLG